MKVNDLVFEPGNQFKILEVEKTLDQASLPLQNKRWIVRLLVVNKIIINRTIKLMLRVVSKMATTLQKDEISFSVLETKYHAPDKATITTVRDMLFKWINILNKLY